MLVKVWRKAGPSVTRSVKTTLSRPIMASGQSAGSIAKRVTSTKVHSAERKDPSLLMRKKVMEEGQATR